MKKIDNINTFPKDILRRFPADVQVLYEVVVGYEGRYVNAIRPAKGVGEISYKEAYEKYLETEMKKEKNLAPANGKTRRPVISEEALQILDAKLASTANEEVSGTCMMAIAKSGELADKLELSDKTRSRSEKILIYISGRLTIPNKYSQIKVRAGAAIYIAAMIEGEFVSQQTLEKELGISQEYISSKIKMVQGLLEIELPRNYSNPMRRNISKRI